MRGIGYNTGALPCKHLGKGDSASAQADPAAELTVLNNGNPVVSLYPGELD